MKPVQIHDVASVKGWLVTFCFLPALVFVMPFVARELPAQQAVNSFTGVTLFPLGSVVRSTVRIRSLGRLLSNGAEEADLANRDVDLMFIPTSVSYGLTGYLTVTAVVPYFRKELQLEVSPRGPRQFVASGIGDIALLAQYRFLNWNAYQTTVQLAVTGGVEVPTGSTTAEGGSGTRLPMPLELGSGSTDFLMAFAGTRIRNWTALHLSALYKLNTVGARDYRFGDLFNYNVAAEFRVMHTKYPGPELWLGAELNGELFGEDQLRGTPLDDTGGHRLFLSPNAVFFLFRNLTLESSVQVPLLQELNGTQLAEGPRVALGLRFQYATYLLR